MPGIIEGASEGKGRGRQVIAVARSADLVLMVVDAGSGKAERQKELLVRELEVVGLRLNQRPPNVYFKRKKTGGITISSSCQLKSITERDVQQLLHEYRINSAEARARARATSRGEAEGVAVGEGWRHRLRGRPLAVGGRTSQRAAPRFVTPRHGHTAAPSRARASRARRC